MEDAVIIVKTLSRIAVVIPLVLYIYLGNYRTKAINILILLLISSGVTDIVGAFLSQTGASNIVALNVFIVVQFILVSILYFHLYKQQRGSLKTILVALGIILIFLNWILLQEIHTLQNITWAGTSLLMASMAFGYVSLLIRNPVTRVREYAPYWITTGILFYCTLTFVVFAFAKVLVEQLKIADFEIIWMFHNANNILQNVCFTVAIWWATKRNPRYDQVSPFNN
jgi:hypothetical protein